MRSTPSEITQRLDRPSELTRPGPRPLDPTEVMTRLRVAPARGTDGPGGLARPSWWPRGLRGGVLAVLGGFLLLVALATAGPSWTAGSPSRAAGAATPAAQMIGRAAAPPAPDIGAIGATGAIGAIGTTPNVIGRSVADAGAALIAAGFGSPISWRADPAAPGTPCAVVRQDPSAGARFRSGAAATLVIVRGSCR